MVGGTSTPGTTTLVVRPRRSLVTTAVISGLLAFAPLFAVLAWLGSEHDGWLPVAIVALVVLLIGLALLVRQLSLACEVTDTELRGNGIFTPTVCVSLDTIRTVLLVPTYVGHAREPVTQLLVRDARGRRLFRMRGNFWQAEDLVAIAESLRVPVTVIKEPITIGEFYEAYPGSSYWFEDSPLLRVTLIAVGAVCALGLVSWIMTLLGLPLGFLS